MRIHSSAVHYFDAVRRAGSIREAARRLNVASSAVNRQILKLEDEIGMPLFERHAGGVYLTTAGEMLARHTIVVLQDLERARSDIQALQGARLGHVSVAAVEGVSTTLLPAVITRLHEAAPRIRVSTRIMGSKDIPVALSGGTADVGIAFGLAPGDAVRRMSVARFRIGAIMSPKHPLATRGTVGFSTCCDYPLIGPGPSLSTAELVGTLFAKSGRSTEPTVVTDSIEMMRRLAMHIPMIAFQTPIGMDHLIDSGLLAFVPLDEKGPVWTELGVYVRSGRSLPAAVELFLQFVNDELLTQQKSA